jgi:RNA polymerase sigma factor (sigma-70 family)
VTSDGDLVRRVLGGDAAAYEDLVRRWAGRVLAVCHSRVGRAGMAEDLAQESLLRGYAALGSLSDPDKFGPWLHGIATRVCLDWLKAKERTQVTFSDLGGGSDPEGFLRASRGERPEDGIEKEDEVRSLLAEVSRLPEELRRVLFLFYYEDLSYRDMAEVLGVSAATVNLRLTKARGLLRRRLGAPVGGPREVS